MPCKLPQSKPSMPQCATVLSLIHIWDGYFLENNKKGDVVLYFYVNKNAVIIGRNQNA